MSDEKDLVFEFKQKREDYQKKKSEASQAYQELEQAQAKLIEHMEDSGKKSTAKYEGIGQISLKSPMLHARFAPENSDKVFEFLKSEGLEDVIKESVHHKTLSSFIASRIKEGESVPEFFELSYKKQLAFTKA